MLSTDPENAVRRLPDPYPRLLLLGDYTKMSDPDAMALTLANPNFNARKTAILETTPDPAPTPMGAAGTASIMRESINDMEIVADLSPHLPCC